MKSLLAYFSGGDGKTALVATQATGGVVTFLGLAIWHVVHGAAFDMGTFATSFGVVLAASAGAIGGHSLLAAKADAIPSAPDAPAPGGA